jgi:hypothetical protein
LPEFDVPSGPLSPWTNPTTRFDVNLDGRVTARDALTIINRIGLGGSNLLESNEPLPAINFYDTTDDLMVTALDALRVINALNRVPVESEAHGQAPTQSLEYLFPSDDDDDRIAALDEAFSSLF